MQDELEIGGYDHDDELIAAAREERRGRLRVYRLQEAVVVLGRGSEPDRELVIEACLDDRIPLLRRSGGGCSVVVDPGNVIVSAAIPLGGFGDNKRHFDRLSAWLVRGLEACGVEGVETAGISDLAIGERKISGACIRRSRDLLYYSATLLVDADLALIDRYLQHPPREPEYRRGRAHGDFVGRIQTAEIRTAAELEARLRDSLQLPGFS